MMLLGQGGLLPVGSAAFALFLPVATTDELPPQRWPKPWTFSLAASQWCEAASTLPLSQDRGQSIDVPGIALRASS